MNRHLQCVALSLVGAVLAPGQSLAQAPFTTPSKNATVVTTLPYQDLMDTRAASTDPDGPFCSGRGPIAWTSGLSRSSMVSDASAWRIAR